MWTQTFLETHQGCSYLQSEEWALTVTVCHSLGETQRMAARKASHVHAHRSSPRERTAWGRACSISQQKLSLLQPPPPMPVECSFLFLQLRLTRLRSMSKAQCVCPPVLKALVLPQSPSDTCLCLAFFHWKPFLSSALSAAEWSPFNWTQNQAGPMGTLS